MTLRAGARRSGTRWRKGRSRLEVTGPSQVAPAPRTRAERAPPRRRSPRASPSPHCPRDSPELVPWRTCRCPHSPPGYDISHQRVTHSASAIFSPPSLTRAAHAPPGGGGGGGRQRGGVDPTPGPRGHVGSSASSPPPPPRRPLSKRRLCYLWELTGFPQIRY